MRITAYVLAGDPAWAAQSLGSYYDLVDEVVVSHDRRKLSWAGHPLGVDASVAALRSVDTEGKIRVVTGDHSDPARPTLVVETEQRQAALDAASEGADVVLQLDTDEVVLDTSSLLRHISVMLDRGDDALEYPLRDFYSGLGGDRFLEHCRRGWRTQAAYPGPIAVLPGTPLVHCRQAAGSLYRVDVRSRNTDPWHPRSAPVHAVVRPDAAIAHLSWVRTDEEMSDKSRTSGYAAWRDWDREIARWRWRSRHPVLASLSTPLRRDPSQRFRISRVSVGDRTP